MIAKANKVQILVILQVFLQGRLSTCLQMGIKTQIIT